MLRIEIFSQGQMTILRLSGRIQADDLSAIREQLHRPEDQLVFDMREIQLVDEAAVRFLAECESMGIILRHCATYIEEWIRRTQESP